MRDRSWNLGWLTASLLLALAGVLAGCGGGGAVPEGQAPSPSAPAGGSTSAPAAPTKTAEQRNEVVARVNGEPLHAWQLDEVFAIVSAQVQAQGFPVTPEMEPQLRRVAMDLVIRNELVHQQAKADGMTVDPRQLEERLQEVRSRFGTEQGYHDYLQAAGLTEDDVREEAEYTMLIRQWVQSVTGNVAVDEKAARDLYEQWKPYLKEPGRARAAFILVNSSPEDPEGARKDARARIDEAYEKLQQGVDFAQVAREYSQAPSAAQGGDVGYFPRGVMAPQFEEKAFTLPVGETSEVFETAFGFNILKVIDRKEDRPLSYEEVKPNLMLQAAEQEESTVLNDKVQALYDKAGVEVLLDFGDQQPETAQGQAG